MRKVTLAAMIVGLGVLSASIAAALFAIKSSSPPEFEEAAPGRIAPQLRIVPTEGGYGLTIRGEKKLALKLESESWLSGYVFRVTESRMPSSGSASGVGVGQMIELSPQGTIPLLGTNYTCGSPVCSVPGIAAISWRRISRD